MFAKFHAGYHHHQDMTFKHEPFCIIIFCIHFKWMSKNKKYILYSSISPLGLVFKHTQHQVFRGQKETKKTSLYVPCVAQRTVRSWQDFDFCLKAIFLFLRATMRPRNRFAFLLMLSLRLQLAMRRAFSSLLSFLKRICLTMPSNRSCTLWWREADVSINLQSNTTAHALPSAMQQEEKRRLEEVYSYKEHHLTGKFLNLWALWQLN